MISGEQFQKLSEIGLYGELNCIIEDQVRMLNQNIKNINEFDVVNIKDYKKIFVYTHFLIDFFKKYYEHLAPNTVLISHNSDHCVDEQFLKYLKSDKIFKWYCQNRLINHPKLISLPIGIANSQWPHGDQNKLKQIRDLYIKKSNLVFKNFDKSTNRDARFYCDEVTNKNSIFMSPRTSNEEYWLKIASSKFVISPPGNGIDCHRIWECLYLRSVPVVLKHEALMQFKHLPILFVDSWEEVSIEFLQKREENFTNVNWDNIRELDINYWKNII